MVKLESDIASFFQKPIESQEVQQYLDKEYKSVLSIGDNQNLENFKAPNKTWKQIKEDRDRLKSLETKKSKEFESNQIINNSNKVCFGRFQEIDRFIKEESEAEEEEVINNRSFCLNIEEEIIKRAVKHPSSTSISLESYIESESRNRILKYREKAINLERERYFELYREEYSDLLAIIWRKYKDLHIEVNSYFKKKINPRVQESSQNLRYILPLSRKWRKKIILI
jgi:hypothetical protein